MASLRKLGLTETIRQLPLAAPRVEGLFVVIEDPDPPPDLAYFVLANIIVKAKGVRGTLRVVVSFPPGFTGTHGDLLRRIAVYADGFGLPAHPRWRTEADWIAREALNKPVFLMLEASPQSSGSQMAAAYLATALQAAGSGVEMLWVEPRNVQDMQQLLLLKSPPPRAWAGRK